MVVLRMRSNGKGQGKSMNIKESQPTVQQLVLEKSVLASAAGSDMLMWLKGLALDPCEPDVSKHSVHGYRDQTLKLRKVWHSTNAEGSQRTTFSSPTFHQRKRKTEQFLDGGKYSQASGLASKSSNYQNVKKVMCQKNYRSSCTSDSALTFDNCLKGKQLHTDSNTSDNITSWDPFTKDIFSLVETSESFNDSNFFSPENIIAQDQPLEDSSYLISSSHSSSSEVKLQQVISSVNTDSESQSENPPRAVIPIGPKFQAEFPDWTGPIKKEHICDSETLKWLGTKIWPIDEVSSKSNMRRIGRGRPQSCSCASPGSTDCIKCHMLSARHNLQSELGPAFLIWKFDEMGEVVSNTWTLKEQNMFQTLVKRYLMSNENDFWECASKCFPSNSKKMILSYYYNVFNLRRMSRLTRSSPNQVDSDEDEVDDKYL